MRSRRHPTIRLASMMLAATILVGVAGCGAISRQDRYPVLDLVWIGEEDVFYIENEQTIVQHKVPDVGRTNIDTSKFPGMCVDGSPAGLWRVLPDELGITVDCGSGERILYRYDRNGEAEVLLRGRDLGQASFGPDLRGYVAVASGSCESVLDTTSMQSPLNGADECGQTQSEPGPSCRSSISRNPVLADDKSLFYLATANRSSNGMERWALCRLLPGKRDPDMIGEVVGATTLDVSAGGHVAAIAVTGDQSTSFVVVDILARALHTVNVAGRVSMLSISPDGSRVALVKDYYELAFADI